MNEIVDMTLRDFMDQHVKVMEPTLFFSMALQMADLIHERHQWSAGPCGIDPEQIGLQRDLSEAKLYWLNSPPEISERRYAYMSPEQTGRMFREPDHRSDLYGLGVLFYEWLTGETPFQAATMHEWTHAHMAMLPVPVVSRQRQVPKMLNDLVMKLLAKSPEERYQSARGLQDDLRICADAWVTEGTIASFSLGALDDRSVLRLPSKLYGRDSEWQAWQEIYGRSIRGAKELLLIGGHTGSGKSALLRAFQNDASQQGGYSASGKCEPLLESKPYAPFIAAVTKLIRQRMAAGEAQREPWRRRLLDAVGKSGSVLVQVIPELSWLLGKHQPLEPLSPLEATNRFRSLFGKVIQAFADEKHPLVLGLDDLQWADSGTLHLLSELWQHSSLKHVVIIGTYREHEVSQGHKLQELLLKTSEADAAGVSVMNVHGLTYHEVLHYLSDLLQEEGDALQPFADVLYRQTAGNPLYIHKMVETCHEKQWLWFHADEMCWKWDLQAMTEMAGYGQVADLIRSRVHDLPAPTRKVLRVAGCLGASFELDKLALVTKDSPEQLIQALSPAVSEGWLMPEPGRMRFLHDQVQMAAYELNPEELKAQAHLDIGRSLRESLHAERDEERLFEVVHHMNLGREHIAEQAEAEQLAVLNLRSGIAAKAAAAYGQALELLTAGVQLAEAGGLAEPDWLYVQLLLERSECLYFCGQWKQAEEDLHQLLLHTEAVEVRARIYTIMIMMYAFHRSLEKAADTALQAMQEFGFSIPSSTSRASILLEVARTQLALAHKRMELSTLPSHDDAAHQALSDIVMVSSTVIYVVNPELAVVMFAKYVRRSLQQGLGDAFAIALGSYAIALAFGLRNDKQALHLAETAWHYAKQSDSLLLKGKIRLITALVKQHAQAEQIAPLFEQAVQLSLECGDLVSAGHAMSCHVMVCDGELKHLDRLVHAYEEQYGQVLDQITLRVLYISKRYVELLQHGSEGQALQFRIPYMVEEKLHPGAEVGRQEKGNWFYYYTCRLEVAFIYSRYPEAVTLAEKAGRFKREIMVTIHQKYSFYHALALMAEAAPLSRLQPDQRTTLRRLMNRMRAWSKSSPDTTLAKYRIMQAEYARVSRKNEKALRLYDLAIEHARQAGDAREAAIAAELAAGLCRRMGDLTLEAAYLQKACEAYAAWGAAGKVRLLQASHPALTVQASGEAEQGEAPDLQPSLKLALASAALHSANLGRELDLELLRQMAGLSHHDHSERRLPEKFLQLALHTTGAERGVVLLCESGRMTVEARLELNGGGHGCEIQDCYASSVVQFVQQTKEPVVVGDAGSSIFAKDDYIVQQKPRSMLCMAIRDANHQEGILYLENNLTAGAFTNERVDMLELVFSRMVYGELKQLGRLERDVQKPQAMKAQTSEPAVLVDPLTRREMEIVQLLAEGLSNKQVAASLHITEGTVKSHVNRIYGKLQVNRRVQAIQKARELQLIE
ncbi:AAA family ATPase [Paenibacillus sp. F411]|uniref:helix-turn-helix transcriptional regulator n=1 Tax=Paenibacillus sp. F411 TaxID=2820239 RepID=UPI001AAE1ABF|nr:AAA family ATPase [Paenibacillus sp. F411]MBO2944533.1 AAA family ATPase [Paenibacillus sp. F411]